MSYRVLVVDDEPMNLEILEDDLLDEGYEVVTAEDGQIAYDILQKDDAFDVILLDRMMPNMNGMELISKIKSDKTKKVSRIPIIMQTAAAEKKQVVEGIQAGVYYYLTKPFESEVMLSIVRAAASDYAGYSKLRKEIDKYKPKLKLVRESYYEVKTLEDVRYLATFLANFFPDPERVIFGLSELLTNAVEHGNLGITYDQKTKMMRDNVWEEEVARLQELPKNSDKKVLVHFVKQDDYIALTIIDDGEGFNWRKYLNLDPERATDSHGRGIALTKSISFDDLEFQGDGNIVVCKVNT
jgi:DNA-binding response OmpR family regulator/anti-sigma regulatory factor (Ser/Thr protein kinase)